VTVTMPTCPPPHVLVVDDEEAVCAALQAQITGHGYRVSLAGSVKEATEVIRRGTVDLLILDLLLPDRDGTELILKLRSDRDMLRVPIIVVTAAPLESAKQAIMTNFAIPALTKPWSEKELLERVEGAFVGTVSALRGRTNQGAVAPEDPTQVQGDET